MAELAAPAAVIVVYLNFEGGRNYIWEPVPYCKYHFRLISARFINFL